MVTRRPSHSSKDLRRLSERARTATLGSHVSESRKPAMRMDSRPRTGGAHSMRLADSRGARRTSRGTVNNIMSASASPYSDGSRVSRKSYAASAQRKSFFSTVAVAVICVAIVLGVAAFVGMTVFYGSIDSQMTLEDSDLTAALTTPKDGDGYFVLMTADLDLETSQSPHEGPDVIALIHVTDKQNVSAVMIPANSMVTLSDGKQHQLREAALEGDAALVKKVSELADVDIAHYAKTDALGIIDLVDYEDGLKVKVPQKIDDPVAGSEVISAGKQKLNGKQVLTLLRATNLEKGLDSQASNQGMVLRALAKKLIKDSSAAFLRELEKSGSTFGTDVSAKQAAKIAKSLKDADFDNMGASLAPGYEDVDDDGNAFYALSSDELVELVATAESGQASLDEPEETASVNPDSFTITVRNGSGATGAATQMADTLTGMGFKVEETGNTDSYAYEETLVIYLDSDYADACQTVVDSLGMGRVVDGTGFYNFDTDVLVVLGSDWVPVD